MLTGLNHITIAVSDLDRSLLFYTQLLGMKPYVRWDNGAYLSLGQVWFCLSCDAVKPSDDYSHIALDIADENFDGFIETLRTASVVEWKQNKSEGKSMYLLDPDGHKLEIHAGNLQTRLTALKAKPYAGLIYY